MATAEWRNATTTPHAAALFQSNLNSTRSEIISSVHQPPAEKTRFQSTSQLTGGSRQINHRLFSQRESITPENIQWMYLLLGMCGVLCRRSFREPFAGK
jgi:hypothetical protein